MSNTTLANISINLDTDTDIQLYKYMYDTFAQKVFREKGTRLFTKTEVAALCNGNHQRVLGYITPNSDCILDEGRWHYLVTFKNNMSRALHSTQHRESTQAAAIKGKEYTTILGI